MTGKSKTVALSVVSRKSLMAQYAALKRSLRRDPLEVEFKKDAKAYKAMLKEFDSFERFAAECELLESNQRWI